MLASSSAAPFSAWWRAKFPPAQTGEEWLAAMRIEADAKALADAATRRRAEWDALPFSERERIGVSHMSRECAAAAKTPCEWSCFYCRVRFTQHFPTCTYCFKSDCILPVGTVPPLKAVK